MKKIIKLANGAIELTVLRDGTLVLAELKRGYVSKKELLIELHKAGISYGLIDKSLSTLEEGQKGQILLATAFIQNEPADLWSHSTKDLDKDTIIECVKSGDFSIRNISFSVEDDERIATITSSPKTILRYPDGSTKQLKDLGIEAVNKLCGENVSLNTETKSILAAIKGSLNRSIYGVISIYPEKNVRSIGKVHGRVKEDNALIIDQDVLNESYIEIPSNVIVHGFIKSSIIETAGNIIAYLGIENSIKREYASIVAGQSIYTCHLKNYPVWAGSHILVNKIIENCTIQCLDTIATPTISNCNISVGNKLITNKIIKDSEIFLSNKYVENEELTSRQSFHVQHEKRISDLESTIFDQQSTIEMNRLKVITQIKKLRKVSENTFGSDLVLNRFFQSITDEYKKMEKCINDYDNTLDLYEKERLELSFFDQQLYKDTDPEIVVLGKIEPGTVITAPNQTLNINEELNNVSIKLDKVRGILKIDSLN